MKEEQQERFDEWAIVDIFGHQKFAGRVTEQAISSGRLALPAMGETESTVKRFPEAE